RRARRHRPRCLHPGLTETGAGSPDDWLLTARDAQLPPAGDWSVWLFLGGRGCGKTHALSCAVHTAVRAGVGRIHFVGPTASDLYDVSIFGPSGIMKTCRSGPLPRWIPSKRRIEWPNGATCIFYSAEEPQSLRGPQCSLCLIDEIGRMRQQAEVFDQANMGLRLGPAPRMLIATTPPQGDNYAIAMYVMILLSRVIPQIMASS